MVHLIPMTEAEFQTYVASSVSSYALKHVRAGNWPEERAQELAEAQLHEILPAGLNTPDTYLWSIVDDGAGERVGHMWFSVRETAGTRQGFVYDVEIFTQFRRRGYARQAFLALENVAREMGVTVIGLHVFGHNAAARALYRQLGFTERDILMGKDLAAT
ncbi:MAG: GNAT family N-acetyltransferase [Chloroflexota bacterium]